MAGCQYPGTQIAPAPAALPAPRTRVISGSQIIVADLLDGDLEQRRDITHADATDAIDWIERVALAIATVLG